MSDHATAKKIYPEIIQRLGIATAAILIFGGWILFPKTTESAKEINSKTPLHMIVHKSPTCGCCTEWIHYLEKNGIQVTVENHPNMTEIKNRLGVPDQLSSCHTGVINGYLVEGHVPIEDILRLLEEHPIAKGIAAPGMPIGSPGMEIPHTKPDRYQVLLFTDNGQNKIFAQH
ncbi:MAG: DUF411 domain-containing protein [Magnetococcus sp. DMHC-6]